MSEFKVPAQVDDSGRGFWVFVPVAEIVESGSTFTNGNPGARLVAEVEHFPGVGTVKMQSTVHLKQPKGKAAAKASADPALVAAAVLDILAKRGIGLESLVPGGATVVPPGTTGADLSAGRAAVGVISGLAAAAAVPSPPAAPTLPAAAAGQDGSSSADLATDRVLAEAVAAAGGGEQEQEQEQESASADE